LGFFADQKLKKVDLAGGGAQPLADAPVTNGAAWGRDNVIVLAPTGTSPLRRVSANGGDSAVDVTSLSPPQQVSHRFPYFLPDGVHFLFFSMGNERSVYLGSLQSKVTRRLFSSDSQAVFSPPDRILYVRQDTLFAQRFDLQQMETIGDPVPVAEHILFGADINGEVAISASSTGLVAYRHTAENKVQFVWFDRSGKELTAVGEPDAYIVSNDYGEFRLSPDSRMIALTRRIGHNYDVWLLEIARGLLRPIATEPFQENEPVWSPNGKSVVYSSRPKGYLNLYERTVDGGPEKPFLETASNKFIEELVCRRSLRHLSERQFDNWYRLVGLAKNRRERKGIRHRTDSWRSTFRPVLAGWPVDRLPIE
jgi:hypothetical protein